MKRIFHLLLTLLLALTVIAAFSVAAATKPKTVGKKNLVPAPPTEAVQQAEEKHLQTQSSTTLPHTPTTQTVQELGDQDESDADIPQHLRGRVDKAEYLRLRDEYIGILRGIDPNLPFDPFRRTGAIQKMEHQIAA